MYGLLEALDLPKANADKVDLESGFGTLRTKWPLKGFMVHIPYWDYHRTEYLPPIYGSYQQCVFSRRSWLISG